MDVVAATRRGEHRALITDIDHSSEEEYPA